jgi:L-rhamnose mutarotase
MGATTELRHRIFLFRKKEASIVKRFGQVIGVKLDGLEEYKKYHADVWPEILDMIRECNIQNYSIFFKDGLLFAYLEYVGDDFDADMAKMAADPKTQEWWDIMKPMQEPLETRAEGEWWANMEEVFHMD